MLNNIIVIFVMTNVFLTFCIYTLIEFRDKIPILHPSFLLTGIMNLIRSYDSIDVASFSIFLIFLKEKEYDERYEFFIDVLNGIISSFCMSIVVTVVNAEYVYYKFKKI